MSADDPKTQALEDIRRRILATEMPPGAHIDETGLARHYALSRTPMREVLQRLAGQGFVTLERNKGAQVARMDLATLRTFFQTAPMVYAAIGQLAAEMRSADDLKAVKSAQQAFAAAIAHEDTDATALANHRFHHVIGQMARNPYLSAALDRLLIDHTRLSQTFYRPRSAPDRARVIEACEQHDAMIAAIEAHEPATMMALTLQHWDLSRDRLEDFVRPDPLPVDVLTLKDTPHAV